jgi:hypothetical protein
MYSADQLHPEPLIAKSVGVAMYRFIVCLNFSAIRSLRSFDGFDRGKCMIDAHLATN